MLVAQNQALKQGPVTQTVYVFKRRNYGTCVARNPHKPQLGPHAEWGGTGLLSRCSNTEWVRFPRGPQTHTGFVQW